jgi:hypothetical protein
VHTLLRYLSFEKFKWLLEDGGLFFSRACDFKDTKEGTFSKDGYIRRAKYLGYEDINPNVYMPLIKEIENIDRSKTYVSCWFKGESSSERMWEEYGKSQNGTGGVAIKTTWFKIYQAIPKELSEVVRNQDCRYRAEQSDDEHGNLYAYKDSECQFENECRFYFNATELMQKTGINIDSLHNQSHNDLVSKKGNGVVIKFELTHIIEEVYIRQSSPDGFETEIAELLMEKGIKVNVRRN